jgi:lysyl-tRNA synthetase class II
MLFLQTFEISTGYAENFQALRQRGRLPDQGQSYDLIYEIRGIGFRTADAWP